MQKGLWVIFFYCIYVAVNDNFIIDVTSKEYEKYIFSFFTLIEYLSFSFFLWLNTSSKLFKQLLLISSVLFTLFISAYVLTNTDFNFIDSVPIGIETILVLIFSFYFLYEQVNRYTNVFIYNKAEFWIVVGFLLYLAGSFFIYIFANNAPDEQWEDFWFITFIFAIIKNILFSIAILILLWESKNNSLPPMQRQPQPFLN